MKLISLVILIQFACEARNPFNYQTSPANSEICLFATACFLENQKVIYFSPGADDVLQVTYQEKSPSTLEKAEGLGG